MTARKRLPGVDGPGGSGDVVSLRARARFRPEYKRLASGQVLAARQKLGTDHAGFAGFLADLLGWRVAPEAVERWENGSIPPGDVLLACAVTAAPAPADVLTFPLAAGAEQASGLLAEAVSGLYGDLLSSVPQSFPASALAGPWVTCYQFSHGGRLLHHADIAHVTAESDQHISAVNHPPEPRTEGRAAPFRNEIEARLASRHLVGRWRNTSDTRYFGQVQLAVLPGETVMEGFYTGLASDVLVSAARWKWVRLDSGAVPPHVRLRDPAALYDLVMNYPQDDAPLLLTDIGEESLWS